MRLGLNARGERGIVGCLSLLCVPRAGTWCTDCCMQLWDGGSWTTGTTMATRGWTWLAHSSPSSSGGECVHTFLSLLSLFLLKMLQSICTSISLQVVQKSHKGSADVCLKVHRQRKSEYIPISLYVNIQFPCASSTITIPAVPPPPPPPHLVRISIWSWPSRPGSSPTASSTPWPLATGVTRRRPTRHELASHRSASHSLLYTPIDRCCV